MSRMWLRALAGSGWVLAAAALLAGQALPRRNVIVFIADGLRHGSVNATDTPALWRVRTQGVHFADSHSLFPTFTMANASAIATGHGLGDTGVFSNTIWAGFATFDAGGFGQPPGTPVPFLENDRILADLEGHLDGHALGPDTFLAMARAHGYRTAAIGKVGPAALQDVAAIAPVNGRFPTPPGVMIDDGTGTPTGLALSPTIASRMSRETIPPEAPTRSNGYGATSQFNNGYTGTRTVPGTLAANTVQQAWFGDVLTKVVLPEFTEPATSPFAIVYWSRDPDGTQHGHGDSLGTLEPGVNGATSRLAARNADRNLQQLLTWLDRHPAVKARTDVFVTSDHGVATISRREIDRSGHLTEAESARHDYVDAANTVDTVSGTLPFGFLAIDLARAMQMNLFDPDQRVAGAQQYVKLRIDPGAATWQHPARGNGLIATQSPRPDGADAAVIVAANGGSDLVYAPGRSRDVVQRVVSLLLTFDYVDGIFVDDEFGPLPGTLPLSAINLVGSARTPRPAVVVTFKVFQLTAGQIDSAVQVSDTSFQEGQGMHGGFGRDSTFNNMAALGPDFKTGFVDQAPVSNADIVPTFLRILRFELPADGHLAGRAAVEALVGSAAAAVAPLHVLRSPAADGRQTVLLYREFDGVRYLEAGCLTAATTADRDACR